MKICIVSDSHDRADLLDRAVGEAAQAGAEAVIHCGDLIGAPLPNGTRIESMARLADRPADHIYCHLYEPGNAPWAK